MNEIIKATGNVVAVLLDEHGNIKEQQEFPNLVVTTGLTFLASRAVGTSSTVMSHMAIGSNSTAPALANTTLGTETGRVALTSGTSSGAVISYVATFGAGVGTGTVAECGLFNASSSGTLLARSTNISLTKGANDTLQITWSITLS
jgi:hypothetical protein